MPQRVVIHDRKRVFDGFFKIDEATVSFERFDGEMSPEVKRLCFERGDSVAALLFNTDSRRLVLVKQFKYPTYDKGPGWIIETVAGMVEGDESPEEALRREIAEEAGFRATELVPIANFYVSPGGSSERILLFYAEVTEADRLGRGGGVPAENEDIRLEEISLDDALAQVADGRLCDAKTILAVLWLQRRLRGDEVQP